MVQIEAASYYLGYLNSEENKTSSEFLLEPRDNIFFLLYFFIFCFAFRVQKYPFGILGQLGVLSKGQAGTCLSQVTCAIVPTRYSPVAWVEYLHCD